MTQKTCAELQARIEVLETILAMIIAAAERGANPMLVIEDPHVDARQCPRCGDTAPPTLDSIDGNRYRYRCGAGCGHATPWSENAEDIREEFYK